MSTAISSLLSSALTNFESRDEVSETCLEVLLIEIIQTFAKTGDSPTDDDKEMAYYKVETIGYRVGTVLGER